ERPRRGFELLEQIKEQQGKLGGGGIFLRQVTEHLSNLENADRLIVISDSQDCEHTSRKGPEHSNPFAKKFNYVIDIANHQNGIAYSKFTVINGFSEKTIDFIELYEDLFNQATKPEPKKVVRKKISRKNLN